MTRGLHTHRFADNPEEQRFSDAWSEWFVGRALDDLLHCGDYQWVEPASDREKVVAATVIQWLGSPVGQGFLRDLGYERRSK